MVGLSLTECIRDIACGNVAISKVDVIISCTRVPIVETWEQVVVRYRKKYWKGKGISPDHCERIFRELLREGKIIQPAITDRRLPRRGCGWLPTLAEVEWNRVDN